MLNALMRGSRSRFVLAMTMLLTLLTAGSLTAQQPPGGGNSATIQLPTSSSFSTGGAAGLPGGGANADFDSLIELIETTVSPDSWQANGTGEGDVSEFSAAGVYVDAQGSLKFAGASERSRLIALEQRKPPAASTTDEQTPSDARQSSPLRYVSLNRLEAAIAARQQARQPLDEAMLTLAGLQRITHVAVYRETGDLVLAGPAGDWAPDGAGRLISLDTGQPVCRLDDLLTLWRRQRAENSSAFGCSIVPRQHGLSRTQQYIAATSSRPIDARQRGQWLDGLQQALGQQDVVFRSLDPTSRVAGILLAADYHMKLIGMGLAKGVPGVRSYLATVSLGANGAAPPMKVLRWWFAMPACVVEASPERDAFALPENCVQVLSENEMLAARGERVHTGDSEDLNRQFAQSFTTHLGDLSQKYPVYAELTRIFETALALTVIEAEGLPEQIGWRSELLLDASRMRLPQTNVPRSVESILNHRVIGGRHIIAGVSGGVWVDGLKALAVSMTSRDSAALAKIRATSASRPMSPDDAPVTDAPDATRPNETVWWWD